MAKKNDTKSKNTSTTSRVSATTATKNKQQAQCKPSAPTKLKMKTKYMSGVVIDGQTWTEKNDGNLMGTCTYNWHDARLWATKAAAKANSERIAKSFRGKKAKSFISAIRIEV